ncbi:MAG: SRPBCC family protein [Bacteroidota bacterium]
MKLLTTVWTMGILLLGLSSSPLTAQDADANVTISKVIEASADDVWGVLRKMDDIHEYSSLIARVEWTGAHGIGGQRVCYSPDEQGYYKESIVQFNDQGRTYSYALVEGVPFEGMVNSFKVVDLGFKKAMIVWTSNYDAFIENPQMTEEQFLAFIQNAIHEMIDNVSNTAQGA